MTRINIIKRILITAAAIIAATLSANAQQVDTIKISNITITHIRLAGATVFVHIFNLITTAGSSLGGLVGNLANTVIRTGATIARTATGENTVTINSGYEFYLVKIEKR